MQILFATNNPAKVARIRKLFAQQDVEILIPSELGLDVQEIDEGSDICKNAKRKALAYHGLTDLPILSNDTAFLIEGEPLDPAKVKRNALGGRDESSLSQDEIAEAIITFYREIVNRHGGQVEAVWTDCFALIQPNGEVRVEQGKRPVILTGEVRGEVNQHFPIRSMYIVKATGKYICEQNEENEAMELAPLSEALKRLLKSV